MVDTTVVVEAEAAVVAAAVAAMEATTLEAVILMLAVVTPWAAVVLPQCMTDVDPLPTPVPDQLADEEIWEDLVPCVDPIHMQRKCLAWGGEYLCRPFCGKWA